jgi:hypothetical protein
VAIPNSEQVGGLWPWRELVTPHPDVRRTVIENARTLAFDTQQFGSE